MDHEIVKVLPGGEWLKEPLCIRKSKENFIKQVCLILRMS
jgi:hypothetical protein